MVSLYYKIRNVKIKRGSGGVNTRILLPHTRINSVYSHHAHKGSKTCHATPAHPHKVAAMIQPWSPCGYYALGTYRESVSVWVE